MKSKTEDSGRVKNPVELAVQLLKTEFKSRLSTGDFINAVDFLTIKAKASAFITLDSEIRDMWLCKNINVELI
jgi:hypothetical protein